MNEEITLRKKMVRLLNTLSENEREMLLRVLKEGSEYYHPTWSIQGGNVGGGHADHRELNYEGYGNELC